MATPITKHDDAPQFNAGFRVAASQANVHDTAPTIAQLTSVFSGVEASATSPAFRFVNDAGGGVNFYMVAFDGTNYFHTLMIKAAA